MQVQSEALEINSFAKSLKAQVSAINLSNFDYVDDLDLHTTDGSRLCTETTVPPLDRV